MQKNSTFEIQPGIGVDKRKYKDEWSITKTVRNFCSINNLIYNVKMRP